VGSLFCIKLPSGGHSNLRTHRIIEGAKIMDRYHEGDHGYFCYMCGARLYVKDQDLCVHCLERVKTIPERLVEA